MTATSRPPGPWNYRLVAGALLLLGAAAAIVSWNQGRKDEYRQAQAEFGARAAASHALTREVLGHYEDALFGLAGIFTLESTVRLEEFTRLTRRIGQRIRSVQAFEWVPVVPHAQRAGLEAALTRSYGRPFFFTDIDAEGRATRAPDRPEYYPIAYLEPVAGNEIALGYDLKRANTAVALERALQTRSMVVSQPTRLVQERENQRGVVMIYPVFRPAAADGAAPEQLLGFLQCVFRLHDLFEAALGADTNPSFDVLFIDAGESDPARRVLSHRPARKTDAADAVTDATFCQELTREFELPFGGRNWRMLVRPRAGWIDAQRTSMPLLRSGSLFLLAGLLAGLVQVIGRRAASIGREVEERTRELAESRRHFASLLESLPGMAYRCTYDDQITVLYVSDGARVLTGWTPEEFRNGTVHFRDCIHPEDIGRVRESTRTALQKREPIETEYRIRTRDGAEKWVLSRGRGIYDEAGNLRFLEGLAIDITAQKQAEAARLALERKMLEGQKLESLGLLAGGIAHDFNNLLSSILGNTSMARLHLGPTNEVETQLKAVEAAALRAAELCRQMLAYAGKGRFVVEPTEITHLVDDLMPLLKISIGHHASMRLQLARNLPPVLADSTQLRQIVMNLVLNAADAMNDRAGEITLITSLVQADGALLSGCAAGAGLPAGEYVSLEVRDTGSGMTPDVMAKIFDPFFTTKFAGRGLGLAAVLGIVRGHQGALRVQSTPGVGSSFQLLLPPATKALPAARPRDHESGARWRSNARVLIVEDEEPVRAVTAEMLKTFGMTPQVADDGVTGMEIFRQDPAAIDLVLLDLLMPRMNGEQTLRELRAVKPDVRVLLMSGYSEADILGRLASPHGRLGFIAKPFTRAILERHLRQMLE